MNDNIFRLSETERIKREIIIASPIRVKFILEVKERGFLFGYTWIKKAETWGSKHSSLEEMVRELQRQRADEELQNERIEKQLNWYNSNPEQ